MTLQFDYKTALRVAPNLYLCLSKEFIIIDANDAYLQAVGRRREDIVGLHVGAAFPDNPAITEYRNLALLTESLERALKTGKADFISMIRYGVPCATAHGQTFEERYWSVIHTPILDADGKVEFLIQNPVDITDMLKLKQAAKKAELESNALLHVRGNIFRRSQALETKNRNLDAELTTLRRLFDHAPAFIAILRGPEHVFELANAAYHELFRKTDVIGKPIRDVLTETEARGYVDLLDRVYASGTEYVGHASQVIVQRGQDGPLEELYVDFIFQPIVEDDGRVSGIFVQGQDVSETMRTRDELRASNQRLRLALEGSGDGIWDWNIVRNEVTYSRRWKEMLGYGEEEISTSVDEWESRIYPDDREPTLFALQACLDGKDSSFSREYRLQCKDGSSKWMLSRAVVVARDSEGRPLRMTGTMTDVSEKRQSEERIWHHANFDALTGLPNRRLFRDRLENEVRKAQRSGKHVALLFIDLDRFKEVNDLLGHDIGDLLLTQAARRLGDCVRHSDTVARLGGDEFTVILTELDTMAHVEGIAQKILAALAEPFRLGKEVAYLSGSVGITMYPADAATPEELVRNADQAMYVAKQAGRNQFSYFTRSMQEEAHHRLRLSGDLRHALNAGQLKVHYQPVVDLTSGCIVKAEALLRWHHPGLGPVDPSRFIPLAEESGMIHDIGNWVFTQAAACSERWSKILGTPFQIGVNKSPVQFLSHSEDINWASYLRHVGLSGQSIAVEITEGLLLNASQTVADKLLEYRDAGMQVALDDFGTGYSSMAYLKKFDIDYLKIDQSFVRDMTVNEGDRAIAESIIMMAHRLGLKVIAEGIETQEQRDLLTAAGCDFGQGYLFSRPAPAEWFERMLIDQQHKTLPDTRDGMH
ncbi:EAL domain-containing protein [Noviherbaspirillum saxi]|uniref:EAL domain-containing protein n=1 Tax=Noviherbaspirillum saxi TaxID=2320863 RepID=A0A3A3FN64_9BURK|nr:EAL domain-containing protein [Noviherbaspirillum saxi]RJF97343.1 EAL domain-containing protein [Noviherbaspirillum saxi]